MELKKLSDEEINEYIESVAGETEEERRELFINKHLKKINTTLDVVNSIPTEIDCLKDFLKTGKIDFAGKECMDITAKLNRCINNINVVLHNIGYKGSISSQTSEKENVLIEELPDNVLHVKFDTLLPKRMQKNGKLTEIQYNLLHSRYRNAFSDYFKDRRYRVYDSKVVFCFIHHYSCEHDIRDHDNFEVKFVIDYLAGYLLTDDSAKYCAHYMDYVMDESDYSEVYIIPEKNFMVKLKELL